jgi:hypothetical protein
MSSIFLSILLIIIIIVDSKIKKKEDESIPPKFDLSLFTSIISGFIILITLFVITRLFSFQYPKIFYTFIWINIIVKIILIAKKLYSISGETKYDSIITDTEYNENKNTSDNIEI